jgi:hypothetical protein
LGGNDEVFIFRQAESQERRLRVTLRNWPMRSIAIILIVFTTAAAVAAQPRPDANTCAQLLRQADKALDTRSKVPKAADAQARRDRGAQACAEGKHEAGATQLRLALRELGVKPTIK